MSGDLSVLLETSMQAQDLPNVPTACDAAHAVTSWGLMEMNAVPLADCQGLAGAVPWLRVFPGEARQLRVVRQWLAALLPDCPARDDIVSVATELSSNAVRHTESGRGGSFAVEVTRHPRAIRIAVADGGSPGEPKLVSCPDGENGRGLLLVRGLAVRVGACGDRHGRLIWADIHWDQTEPIESLQA